MRGTLKELERATNHDTSLILIEGQKDRRRQRKKKEVRREEGRETGWIEGRKRKSSRSNLNQCIFLMTGKAFRMLLNQSHHQKEFNVSYERENVKVSLKCKRSIGFQNTEADVLQLGIWEKHSYTYWRKKLKLFLMIKKLWDTQTNSTPEHTISLADDTVLLSLCVFHIQCYHINVWSCF